MKRSRTISEGPLAKRPATPSTMNARVNNHTDELETLRRMLTKCQNLLERTRREARYDARNQLLGSFRNQEQENTRLRDLLHRLKDSLVTMKSFLQRLPYENVDSERVLVYTRDFNALAQRFNHMLSQIR